MNKSLFKDSIELHVKKLTEIVRCDQCDTYEGSRLRFPCGHCTCLECGKKTEECLVCFPNTLVKGLPRSDVPLTTRVQHTSKLLQAFQEAFHVNVFKNHLISAQSKTEKELFPNCIQAEKKYFNKRKSSQNSPHEKKRSNGPMFAGEQVQELKCNKMENSKIGYVQEWLKKNEKDFKRTVSKSPLGDLDVNIVGSKLPKSHLRKRADIILDILKKKQEKKVIKNVETNYKKKEKKLKHSKDASPYDIKNDVNLKKNLSDNEILVIDDTQSEQFDKIINTPKIDKDKLALLAVQKAEQSAEYMESINEINICNDKGDSQQQLSKKNDASFIDHRSITKNVKFYKKHTLQNTCKTCCDVINKKIGTKRKHNVSITIQNDTFTTVISFSKSPETNCGILKKKSAMVQTTFTEDNLEHLDVSKDSHCSKLNESTKKEMQLNANNVDSEDLFTNDVVENFDERFNKKELPIYNQIVVNDSDSDAGNRSTLEVTADVHRSCEKMDTCVLQEIVLHEPKICRPQRGMTPISTDSSDKENRNPNRQRRNKLKKNISHKKQKF